MASSPAAPAEVDDQKNANTCSLFAISKGLCNGFDSSKFVPGYLDFDQGQIKTALFNVLNSQVVLDSRYPDDFDGKFFSIQDKKGDYFSTTVSITKTTLRTVHCDRTANDRYEHLIVTDLGTGPHCLFVRDYNSATSEFTCLNSWGPNNNPTPVVNSMDITHYYRVSAMASKLKMLQTSSQASTSTTTSNSVQNILTSVLQSPITSIVDMLIVMLVDR